MRGFINNEHDRENLRFLLNASEDSLRIWYSQCTADDIDYAQELFAAYSAEIREMTRELMLECELAKLDHFADAEMVISNIKEKQNGTDGTF
jgi:hypothetical protein